MALRPHSRGYIHIKSADPAVHPRIDPNYLADERDAATLLAGIRAVRRLVQMPSLKDLVVRETRPGPEVQTEQQILDYIRLTTQTTWHVVGAARWVTTNWPLSIPI